MSEGLNEGQASGTGAASAGATRCGEVFLKIRRQKRCIFIDVPNNTDVSEVKRMVAAIQQKQADDLRLLKEDATPLDDNRKLEDYGITNASAKAMSPFTLLLAYRQENGEFETQVAVEKLSDPPELPEVMKPKSKEPAPPAAGSESLANK